jgi:hypothetical protein
VSSAAVGRLGYYQPFLWIGAIFSTIGSGLIYTLQVDSPASHYIGYQVVAGIGMGFIIQTPVIVAQNISPRPDMAMAVAITLCMFPTHPTALLLTHSPVFQFVGGGVGVSVAQSIMNNRLLAALPSDNPTISAAKVLAAGATGLRSAFPNPDDLAVVVNAYIVALKDAWTWSIATSGAAFLAAFAAEWKSISVNDVKKRAAAKAAAEAPTA